MLDTLKPVENLSSKTQPTNESTSLKKIDRQIFDQPRSILNDIITELSIHAGLPPCNEKDDYIKFDFKKSIVDKSEFLDQESIPPLEEYYLDVLNILYRLAQIKNDFYNDEKKEKIINQKDNDSINYLMMHIISRLQMFYLFWSKSSQINSIGLESLAIAIITITSAWLFVLSGEESQYFWLDLRNDLIFSAQEYDLSYLTNFIDLIESKKNQ